MGKGDIDGPRGRVDQFETVFKRNNVRSFEDFVGNSKAQEEYRNFGVDYYGAQNFPNKECFEKIIDRVKQATKLDSGKALDDNDNKMARSISNKLWETDGLGTAFSVPGTMIDFGLKQTLALNKVQGKYYIQWAKAVDEKIDISLLELNLFGQLKRLNDRSDERRVGKEC